MRRAVDWTLVWTLAAVLSACWGSWRWYIGRVATSPEELWTLLALATAVVFAIVAPKAERPRAPWLLPTLLLLAYAVGYHQFFPLARAVLALAALAAVISAFRFGARLHPAICGLCVLALPVIPSLQFYLGYPLRALATGVTVLLLRLAGFFVLPEGTALRWGDMLVVVDAPCSGVKMLWVGCYLACVLACAFRFGWRGTALAVGGTVLLVLLGNALRAVTLFLPEAGVIRLPAWGHDGIGLFVFALTAIGIAAYLQLLQRRRLCAG
ncbi:MAG: archaeosortase/exosortase family protein [Armatimonadota bacterium]